MKKSCELVWVKLAGGFPPLFVDAYNRSQIDNSINESLDGLEAALQQVSTLVGNSKATVILAGDFNCKGISWDTHNNLPGNPIPSVCEKLLRVSAKNGLAQLQREPFRQDSLLDLFFTSNESLVSSFDIIPGISTASEHETPLWLTRVYEHSSPRQVPTRYTCGAKHSGLLLKRISQHPPTRPQSVDHPGRVHQRAGHQVITARSRPT